jgi:hypothetical protein
MVSCRLNLPPPPTLPSTRPPPPSWRSYLPLLRPKMVPYQLHLYAERCEITEGRVAELIMQ